MPPIISEECLINQLKAIAHPARLKILNFLTARGECFCGEIVEFLPLTQSTVSQHLKILKEAGLLEGTIAGPRSCYAVNTQVVRALRIAFADCLTGLEEASKSRHD